MILILSLGVGRMKYKYSDYDEAVMSARRRKAKIALAVSSFSVLGGTAVLAIKFCAQLAFAATFLGPIGLPVVGAACAAAFVVAASYCVYSIIKFRRLEYGANKSFPRKVKMPSVFRSICNFFSGKNPNCPGAVFDLIT